MINCFSNNFSIICTKKGPGRIWDKDDVIEVVGKRIHRCYNLNHPKSDKFEWIYGAYHNSFESFKAFIGDNDAIPPEFRDYGGMEQQRSAMSRLEYNDEV